MNAPCNLPMLNGRVLPGPGAPSTYDPEQAEEIISRISCGEFLTRICQEDGMPASRTVYKWLSIYPKFRAEFARARELGALAWMERAVEISVTPQEGRTITYSADGITMKREDAVAARKLASDTLMKAAAVICPQKFGAKVVVAGDEDAPIQHQHSVRKIERAFVEQVLPAEGDPAT